MLYKLTVLHNNRIIDIRMVPATGKRLSIYKYIRKYITRPFDSLKINMETEDGEISHYLLTMNSSHVINIERLDGGANG